MIRPMAGTGMAPDSGEASVSEPQEPGVEVIDVPPVPEPDRAVDGVIDPADDYTEGGVTVLRGDEPCGLPDDWEAAE
jgi:hypothetical protein